MSKYLITGGAGYKGVKIAEALLACGNEVTIVDAFYFGYHSVLHLVSTRPRLTIVRKDIRDGLSDLISKHDVIVHLAALSGFPACVANPGVAIAVNVAATRALVDALSPGQRLVFASTTAIYEMASDGEVDEETTVDPTGLYTRTKRDAELICLNEHADTVALRVATVMGIAPRMRSNLLVNDFVNRALNERVLVLYFADAKRTFIHIDDCVKAYLMAVDQDSMSGGIWNIGSERLNYSKRQIAEAIRSQVPCDIIVSEMPDKDPRNFTVSFKKVRKLGFECSKMLDETIEELVKLYKFYRSSADENLLF